YQRRWTRPEPDLRLVNGQWIGRPAVPIAGTETLRLPLGRDIVEYAVVPSVGTAAWNSCAGSLQWGQPTDQRFDDAASVTTEWLVGDSPLPAGELAILGHPVLKLKLTSDHPVAYVSAKLCEVDSDGTSALITRGLLNLTHRNGHDTDPSPLTPGEP